MGQIQHVSVMFRGVTYNRFTTVELKSAMLDKFQEVQAKIAERRARVEQLMQAHQIDSATLADVLLQYVRDQQTGHARMSYSNSAPSEGSNSPPATVLIPAGVIANLVTEKELIENETAQLHRLELVANHLRDTEPAVDANGNLYQRAVVHTLTDDEITYLGI